MDALPEERVACEIRSESIVIGRAYVLDDQLVEPADVPVAEAEEVREQEAARFIEAAAAAEKIYRQRIEQTKSHFPVEIRDEVVDMLRAELMLLSDSSAQKKILAAISTGKSAARATFECFKAVSEPLQRSKSPKMQGVAHAIDSVLLTLLQQLNPAAHTATLQDAPDGCIPVTPALPVGLTGYFRQPGSGARIHGMINSGGTQEDHTNIVCRALGVAVARIGAGELANLKTGDLLIIDGADNKIITHPSPATLEAYQEKYAAAAAAHEALIEKARQDTGVIRTRDGQAIGVAANISYSDEVADVNAVNARGIGLYRTELAVQRSNQSLSENKWHRIFSHIVGETRGGKVVIRTIDLEGDKANHNLDGESIGQIVERQLAAALRVAHERGRDRVAIMIPNISSAAHLQTFQDMMDAQAARLHLETVKLGSMVEIPAFVDDLANANSAFYSIGTNDLIANTLGFSRSDKEDRDRYDPTDPAVLKEIEKTAQAGHAQNVPVSVCGDMGSDPRYFALLVGAGIRNLSVGTAAIPEIKELARRIESRDAIALFQKILVTKNRGDRRQILDSFNRARLGVTSGGLDPGWQPPAPSAGGPDGLSPL
jgi:phosphoenolpyruvate-protein kinase (PTS system EI component)